MPCALLIKIMESSEAPWVRRIGNLSSRENLVMTSPNGLRPYRLLGRGIYINLYLALLKSVNIPIKYFVSHFHLPSPEGKVFGKHTKKNKIKSVLDIY